VRRHKFACAAGFSALTKLGDESNLLALAEAAAERPGAEQEAARQGLWSMRGSKIDSKIVEEIGTQRSKIRAELIVAAGERGITSAADPIAKALGDNDPDAQRAALRALRNVGGSAQLPIVLDVLTKASSPADRREATQTLGAVVKRSARSAISQVLSAYSASPSIECRLSLLEVMGQSSNDSALPVLRSSLADENPEIARGAILALSNWERPAGLADLYAIAKDGKDTTLRILALRGYIKQIGLRLRSERPVADSVRLLSEALLLSKEAAEKRSVLALLAAYPSQQSLELAEELLRDESVANEAKAAVTRLRTVLGPQ
jgi:HEAT repeat protein